MNKFLQRDANSSQNLAIANPRIRPEHWQEWQQSAVAADLIRLNVSSIVGDDVYGFLYQHYNADRLNAGRLREKDLRRYARAAKGGWLCRGRELRSGDLAAWGCFKPDRPRTGKDDKPVKYEHPYRMPTGVFALAVPWSVGLQIARQHDLEAAYQQRMRAAAVDAEDKGFWAWVRRQPQIPVVITEGAKKAGALLSAGYAAIALPGIWNGAPKPKDAAGNAIGMPQLHPQLQALLGANPQREVVFAFDNDRKPKTIAAVRGAIARTGYLLERLGCRVEVASWSRYPEKGVDDLIAARGPEAWNDAYAARLSLVAWQASHLGALTYPADVTLNQRYLGTLPLPKDAQIVAISSAKGTGKTETIARWCDEARAIGRKVLVLTHRVQLGEALCDRFGVDYVTQLRASETGGVFGYGLCIDSLHARSQARFNPQAWEEALVIIDECEQVLWHLTNSRTCERKRVEILDNLDLLLKVVAASGGQIVLSDADLSDVSLNCLKRAIAPVLPQPKLHIICNEYQGQGYPYAFLADRQEWLQQMMHLAQTAKQTGKTLIAFTGAQRAASTYGTQNLESALAANQLRVLRIDAVTVADPHHPAFGIVTRLDAELRSGNWDVVIASPTIETGVSIEARNILAVVQLASGVQTADGIRQQLLRVRDLSVPRFIWAPQGAPGGCRVAGGEFLPRQLMRSQEKMAAANIALLNAADAGPETTFSPDLESTRNWLVTWAQLGARHNFGFARYADAIRAGLQREGHRAVPLSELLAQFAAADSPAQPLAMPDLKAIRTRNVRRERKAILAAESIGEPQYRRLADKKQKTAVERHQQRRYELQQTYALAGEDLTEAILALDADIGVTALQRLYYLTVGKAFLRERDLARLGLLDDVVRNSPQEFAPDLNRSLMGCPVEALRLLDIEQFLDPDNGALHDRHTLAAWGERVKGHAREIRAIFGIRIDPEASAIRIAQSLLKKIGLQLQKIGHLGPRGQRRLCYQNPQIPQVVRDLFDRWHKRDRVRFVTPVQAKCNNSHI